MKSIFFTVCVFIIITLSACNFRKEKNNVLFIQLKMIETTLFENDSLNEIYYSPPRAYFYMTAYNQSDNSIFLPLKRNLNDSLSGSYIKLIYKNKEIDFYRTSINNQNIILPRDSIHLTINLYLPEYIVDSNKISVISNFLKNITFEYNLTKSDTILSNLCIPDIVIFETTKVNIMFRDIATKDACIIWL